MSHFFVPLLRLVKVILFVRLIAIKWAAIGANKRGLTGDDAQFYHVGFEVPGAPGSM